MKQKNMLDNLTARYSSLTKSEKKIADYIFANKTESQYLSISQLAACCKVADATISRFCRTLGYDGYNELKLALAKSVGTTVDGIGTGIYEKVATTDSIAQMGQKLYAADIAAISQTLEQIDETAYARAAQYLSRAQRVYCFGQGGSGVLAREAWARFITVVPWFQSIEDNHMQAMAASLCTSSDVILFFSYSGATKDSVDTLRIARERGARVILVTHFTQSPAAQLSDVLLLCGSREGPLQSGGVAAKMGQLFVIDVLYNEFCRQNPKLIDANREVTANALAVKLL